MATLHGCPFLLLHPRVRLPGAIAISAALGYEGATPKSKGSYLGLNSDVTLASVHRLLYVVILVSCS